MPLLFRASLRHLLQNPWQLALVLLGLTLGVATITAVELATASAQRAFELSMDAVNGRTTHQIVGGPQGLSEQLYVELRKQGSIRELAPVVEGYVTIGDESFLLLGIDVLAESGLRDTRLTDGSNPLTSLRHWLTQPGAIMLPASAVRRLGLRPEQSLPVEVAGRSFTATLLTVSENGQAGLDNVVIADIASAQEWLGMVGRLSRMDLRLPAGAESGETLKALRARLPPSVQLIESVQRGRAQADMTAAFTTNLRAMSLLALLVGAFLIYNSVSFSVLRRRRTLAVLRSLGATRGQVAALVLSEAAALGLLGSLAGLLCGLWLGRSLIGLVARTINDLYFVVAVNEIALDTSVLFMAVAAGVFTALAAAALPTLEAARTEPRLGLLRSSIEKRAAHNAVRLAIIGLIACACAWFIAEVSQRSLAAGFASLCLLLIGFALAVPFALRVLGNSAASLAGHWSAVMRLAFADVAASLSRTGVAVAALTVAIAAAIGVAVMVESFRLSLDRWLTQTLQADIYITAPGPGFSRPERQIDPAVVAALVGTQGVVDHSTARRVSVQSEKGSLVLDALGPARRSFSGMTLLAGEPAQVWPEFERGAVLLSESFAYRNQLTRGDRLSLFTRSGAQSFLIAGVFREYGNDRGGVLIHRAVYRQHWNDDALSSLGLYLAPEITAEQILPVLQTASRGRQILMMRSNRDIRALSMTIFERTFAITRVLYWLALGVAAIGLTSALLAYELERARALGILRALGVTPGGIGLLVGTQTLFMGFAAGLAAIPAGLLCAWVLVEVINRRAFGWQIELHLEAGQLLNTILIALACALIAGLYPAWRSARTSIGTALREE